LVLNFPNIPQVSQKKTLTLHTSLELILYFLNIPQDCERKSVNLGGSLELVLNFWNCFPEEPLKGSEKEVTKR
jgi:hypothetical protein